MTDLEKSIIKGKKERFKLLLNRLASYGGKSILEIVLYLGYTESQHSSFNKCAQGKLFPKFLISNIDELLEKLEAAAENPDLIPTIRESTAKENKKPYNKPPIPYLVWVPLDMNLPVANFNGINPPLSFVQMEEKEGIIMFRNTSNYVADGEIFIDRIGSATGIEPGTKIAVKRINKLDWQTDCYYFIIDASNQLSIRELLPGDDKETVRYVSTSTPEGPHKSLSLDRIAAMFSIVDGSCIPRPKRNNAIIPASQQANKAILPIQDTD